MLCNKYVGMIKDKHFCTKMRYGGGGPYNNQRDWAIFFNNSGIDISQVVIIPQRIPPPPIILTNPHVFPNFSTFRVWKSVNVIIILDLEPNTWPIWGMSYNSLLRQVMGENSRLSDLFTTNFLMKEIPDQKTG